MALTFPRPMPENFASDLTVEIDRADLLSPESGGRTGGGSDGFPRWMLKAEVGSVRPSKADELRAWQQSLRGTQRLFFGRDLNRPYPLAYPNGFAGLTAPLAMNTTFAGAVAGTSGTAPTGMSIFATGGSSQVVGLGTESGVPYMDVRFFGTSGGAPRVVGVILATKPAAAGQAWATGFDAKQTGGGGGGATFVAALNGLTAGGAFVEGASSASNMGATKATLGAARTFVGATVAQAQLIADYTIPASTAYDVTVRLYAPTMTRSFAGSAESWSVNTDGDQLTAGGLPASFALALTDWFDLRWQTGGAERRSLHRLVEAGSASAGGVLSGLSFEPPLPTLVPAGAVLNFAKPECLMRQTPESALSGRTRTNWVGGTIAGVQTLLE